jgi:hypothetical protein
LVFKYYLYYFSGILPCPHGHEYDQGTLGGVEQLLLEEISLLAQLALVLRRQHQGSMHHR